MPGRADPVDPAADLGHEHAAVREGRRAVRGREPLRRVVPAGAGVADLPHDAVGAVDEEDAAVLDVGDHEEPALQQVGVVRVGEVARPRPRHARMAVRPDHPVLRERDEAHRLVVLLVDRDALVVGREERVVRVVEGLPRQDVSRAREAPDDVLRGRDDQDPVVVAVGDHHVAGHGAGLDVRQAEDPLSGRLRRGDLSCGRRSHSVRTRRGGGRRRVGAAAAREERDGGKGSRSGGAHRLKAKPSLMRTP